MTGAIVVEGKAVEVVGHALDLIAMIAASQSQINAMPFGVVSFHVGSDQAVMRIETQVLKAKWGAGNRA